MKIIKQTTGRGRPPQKVETQASVSHAVEGFVLRENEVERLRGELDNTKRAIGVLFSILDGADLLRGEHPRRVLTEQHIIFE